MPMQRVDLIYLALKCGFQEGFKSQDMHFALD
ncbi:MAG: hypothetical protein QOD75_1399 [Blastocatellia bacterium]|nr:hypothetical protein [Blastocatellia bacterium]